MVSSRVRFPYSFVLTFAASLAVMAVYSLAFARHRILWSDELFGWMLVTDPDPHHMVAAWRGGADGGGIAFYILCRAWLAFFGRTVVAFRMFSVTGCALAFTAMFALLRRSCGNLLGLFAAGIAFAGSYTVLWQCLQTRFYGLLLASVALAWLALVRYAERRRTEDLAAVTLSMVLLVHTHPLGLLYGAVLLLPALLHDTVTRRWQPRLYAACAVAWMTLGLAHEALASSAHVGKPWFWTTRPAWTELLYAYTPRFAPWLPAAALVVLAAVLSQPSTRAQLVRQLRSRPVFLLQAVALMLIPLAVWSVSQQGTSFFVGRYLVPFVLGVSVLVAELCTLFARVVTFRPLRTAGLLAACSVAGLVVHEALLYPRGLHEPPSDFTPFLAAAVPRGLPVVLERVDLFDIMLAEQGHAGLPMLYLLDWDVVTAPSSPRGSVSGFHEMENWQRFGYYAGSIQQSDQFLAATERFIVIDDPAERWFELRIAGDPHWRVQTLSTFSSPGFEQTIRLVERAEYNTASRR